MIRKAFSPISTKVKNKQIDLFADVKYTLNFDGFMYENGRFLKGYARVADPSYLKPPDGVTEVYVSDEVGHAFVSQYLEGTGEYVGFCVKGAKFGDRLRYDNVGAFFADLTEPNGKITPTAFAGEYRLIITKGVMDLKASKLKLKFGTVHDMRLFGIDCNEPYRIRWDGGINDVWSPDEYYAGYVDLQKGDGVPLRLFSLDRHRLLIVKSSGFNIINTYGLPMNYKLENTAQIFAGGEINPRTCAVSNGKLYYYTESGLHSFDGSEVKKVEDFCKGMYISPISAAALGNKYYLACKTATDDKSAIYIYDTQTGACGLTRGGATGLGTSKSKVYGCENKVFYQIVKSDGVAEWQSKEFDFGEGKACLTAVLADCADDAEIEIKSEYGKRFLRGGGSFRVALPGRKFSVNVKSQYALNGLKLTAEATEL